ncbi:hypothetical protein B0H14DRAFT_2642230 [Mycena olivaceomarginata]|nr:hypothetical protein B0H14DRAFT_2642230 [Mycena olivaceomarginata]
MVKEVLEELQESLKTYFPWFDFISTTHLINTELSCTPLPPPILAYIDLKCKWAVLACHETGSLVVQHDFENREESAKDGIVDKLLGQVLEHGSEKHPQMALQHLPTGLLEFAMNEQGNKSLVKALKEGVKEMLNHVVQRMYEPAKGAHHAIIMDLTLSLMGNQLIASVLPTDDKDQRAALYNCIRRPIVTLLGCKTSSKWYLVLVHPSDPISLVPTYCGCILFSGDRMRTYYGY